MLKKLILTLVLFMFMTVSAFAMCILPQGTLIWRFVPVGDGIGVQKVYPGEDTKVTIHKEQPNKEQLRRFSKEVSEDWNDGVVVTDPIEDINVMVHRKDLICE